MANIGKYVKPLSSSVFVIADNFVAGVVGNTIQQSFEQADIQLTMAEFSGECCHTEINLVLPCRPRFSFYMVAIVWANPLKPLVNSFITYDDTSSRI